MQEIGLNAATISIFQDSLRKDPVKFVALNLKRNAFRLVYDYLIRCHHALKVEIAVSQKRMAEDLGLSEDCVGDAIRWLKYIGLIAYETIYTSIIKRGYKLRRGSDGKSRKIYIRRRRNLYKISPIIFEPSISSQLSVFFSGLSEVIRNLPKYIAISLLFVNSLYSYPKKECQLEYTSSNRLSLYRDSHSLSSSIYQSREVIYTSRAPTSKKRKRTTMLPPLTDYLRSDVTQLLHLTKKGQLYLSAFTDEALKHAVEGLKHMASSCQKTNFKLFLNLCYNHSRSQKLPIQMERSEELMVEYGLLKAGSYYRMSDSPKLPSSITSLSPEKTKVATEASKLRKLATPSPSRDREGLNLKEPSVHPIFADQLNAFAEKMGYLHLFSNKKLDN